MFFKYICGQLLLKDGFAEIYDELSLDELTNMNYTDRLCFVADKIKDSKNKIYYFFLAASIYIIKCTQNAEKYIFENKKRK